MLVWKSIVLETYVQIIKEISYVYLRLLKLQAKTHLKQNKN